jgi:hypothetical protein
VADRALVVPRYRPRHERAFAPEALDLKLALHIRFTGGFFVEAPAHDGVHRSATLFFARYRGWRGLLIEPNPELAERCRELRPESVVEVATLAADDASAPPGAGARTLDTILDPNGAEAVDLLCLGDEAAAALGGLDTARHLPEYLLVRGDGAGDVDRLTGGRYAVVERLSGRDVLYRPRG